MLDVWLIYRCAKCKSTWNLTVLSRVNPKSINRQLLNRYLHNDSTLAQQCSMDSRLFKQNGIKMSLPEYRITGPDADWNQLPLRIEIIPDYPTGIRAAKIIREKLRLSLREFNEMTVNEILCEEDDKDIRRIRLIKKIVILIISDKKH